MNRFLSLLIFLSAFSAGAQGDLTTAYIDRFQAIAIEEMNRTGIPASITLAQGLLESNWGRSELAVQGNNHFGIKCGNDWAGEVHYRHDDEFHDSGARKESCFRVYESPEESYYDHSEFLTDPKKTERYGFLFQLATDDYESWAHGLSKAGYATDPKYAQKLIQIIEKYKLSNYDTERIVTLASYSEPGVKAYRIDYINTCKATTALGGERADELADKMGISIRQLKKYNPFIHDRKQILPAGQTLFLEEKKAYYTGSETTHRIVRGESLESISHRYGIDPEYLISVNNLKNTSLVPGSYLALTRQATYEVPSKEEWTVNETEETPGEYLFDRPLTPVKP